MGEERWGKKCKGSRLIVNVFVLIAILVVSGEKGKCREMRCVFVFFAWRVIVLQFFLVSDLNSLPDPVVDAAFVSILSFDVLCRKHFASVRSAVTSGTFVWCGSAARQGSIGPRRKVRLSKPYRSTSGVGCHHLQEERRHKQEKTAQDRHLSWTRKVLTLADRSRREPATAVQCTGTHSRKNSSKQLRVSGCRQRVVAFLA